MWRERCSNENMEAGGQRKIGRPKLRWYAVTRKDMKEKGVQREEAQDRRTWRLKTNRENAEEEFMFVRWNNFQGKPRRLSHTLDWRVWWRRYSSGEVRFPNRRVGTIYLLFQHGQESVKQTLLLLAPSKADINGDDHILFTGMQQKMNSHRVSLDN